MQPPTGVEHREGNELVYLSTFSRAPGEQAVCRPERLCSGLAREGQENWLSAAVPPPLQTSSDYSRFIGAPKQPSILAINFPERKLIEVPLRGDEK